ncbi:glycosyltransferase family 2 protein [Clostridium butyricum]|uniref:glycosyltransferase family 2 protein n=1 Tax=Clostridium butyricum TaxID=1492 RepID=UPI000DEA13C9|nr:glycosyltransferase family 2 protein [Clostridium butyricum]AXB83696.1 hypothetical protein DRB99_01695 [Clostridium butyricum]
MNEIICVVVTYNRKKMLVENIEALLKQSYKKFDILVVDNASTDGTYEEILSFIDKKEVNYVNTERNLGGAGGFSFGVKYAIENNYKYCWVMDDDTIMNYDALESLINKVDMLKDKFSFLCSLVKWKDGEICKMNIPGIDKKWIYTIDPSIKNLIPIEYGSFVSCFINIKYVKLVGLPIKEFFIYADDYEFTQRLYSKEHGYLDLDSIAIHKMGKNNPLNFLEENPNRIDRYVYMYRNSMYISRKKGGINVVKQFLVCGRDILKVIFKPNSNKFRKVLIILKGMVKGLMFNPKIEF